jgi:hypothetical protein
MLRKADSSEFGFSAYDCSDKSFPTLLHPSGVEGSEALNRSFGETPKILNR